MWLDSYYQIKSYKGGKPQFKNAFMYWRNQLFNRVNKLYTWKNLPFPQKEIETRLILFGKCGIAKTKSGELVATNCSLFGVTNYYDIFTSFNWCTPLTQGTVTIGVDGVLIDNDTLRNPIIPIIDRYSMMLAHTEISLINALVNGRAQKTFVANSNKVAQDIRTYQNKLYDGANDCIVDTAFIGLDVKDNDNGSLSHIKNLYDVRQNLLYSFYEDLGIKKNQQKKERMVTDEVSADNTLLKLNILDMTDARKRACDEINRIFGTNITVECNVDYDEDGIPDGEKKEGEEVES